MGLQASTAPAAIPAASPCRRATNQVSTPTARAPQRMGSTRMAAASDRPVTTRTSCSRNENIGWLLNTACSPNTAHGGPGRTKRPTVWALSKSSERPRPGR